MRTKLIKEAGRTLVPMMSRVGFPRRRRHSTAMTAAKGLGAAAVAVPVGLWLGRMIRGGGSRPTD